MIKLTHTRLLSFFCLLLAVSLLSSCKKDEAERTSQIQLLSYGPTGAMHGDTLRFFGTNLDKVTEIQFTGPNASVKQSEFKKQNWEEILLIVPESAERGYLTLKTPQGDIVTKTMLNLSVASSVTAVSGPARPGENVTLTGNYLNWVKSVTFNKNLTVTNFVSQSLNQLVVTIPETAQTGRLVIEYGGTDSTSAETDTLWVKEPKITAVSPTPVKHATNLTLTGTDLDLARKVIFPGVSTPVTAFESQSATQIVVKVPGGATKGKVSVEAPSGVQTQSSVDMDVVLPAITAMAPSPVDPGANVTITGTNLDLVTGISFVGGTSTVTSFVSQTPTQIVVKVPTGVLKGKLVFNVLNSTLTVQSPMELVLTGGLPALADFTFPIYTDGLQNGFQDWSYTTSKDFNNTENVRQGTKAIKAEYGGNGYQGITFHHSSTVPVGSYTKFEFSVFAPASLNGKKLQVVTNGAYGGSVPQVTLVGGEWTTFSVPLSGMGSFTEISEIVLQGAGLTGTVYIDHVGLR